MDFFGAIVLLALYHFFISIKFSDLRKEAEFLKQRVAVLEGAPKPTTAPEAAVFSPQSQYSSAPSAEVPQMYTPIPSTTPIHQSGGFVEWVKQDFLVKVGALLLLIAFGWIVSYAFANNWIGPAGRIALGLLAGVAFMALGIIRMPKAGQQGGIFTVLGSTIILLTTFAAREMYDFFTPIAALLIMFLSVVFVTYVSIKFNRRSLALAGLILGGIAPFLTNASDSSIVTLSLYLLVLVVGTLWVVKLTRAPALTPAALIMVGLYNLMYVDTLTPDNEVKGLLFAFVFTAIFFLGNIASMLRRDSAELKQSHVTTAFGTGLFLVIWIMAAAPAVWQTPLYLLWLFVFSTGAFVVYQKTSERAPFYIYSAVALGLLGAATANEFSGAVLTIVSALEITVLVLAAKYLLQVPSIARRVAWLFAIPLLLSVEHLGAYSWQSGFLHADFIALLVLTGSLFLSASCLYEARSVADKNKADMATTLFAFGCIYVLSLIWLVLHSVISYDNATTLSLIIYTLLGLSLYIKGRHTDHRAFVVAGSMLLGGVVLRLLLVDVWDMALTARIITFIIIGVLLLSTAFIKKPNNSVTE